MRDLREKRLPRAGVREERLRATSGLRQPVAMSSWRGLSGRRYVVGVHPLSGGEIADLGEAVVIAVERAGDGTAAVVGTQTMGTGTTRRSRLRWLALMRTRGATEMHVHLLAEDEAEREAVARDLSAVGG